MLCDFYKKHDGDTIWWIRDLDKVASTYFTFDKKIITICSIIQMGYQKNKRNYLIKKILNI